MQLLTIELYFSVDNTKRHKFAHLNLEFLHDNTFINTILHIQLSSFIQNTLCVDTNDLIMACWKDSMH